MAFQKYQNIGAFIRDCAGSILRHDEACLEIYTENDITFYSQYSECKGCILLPTANVSKNIALKLKTFWPLNFRIEKDGSNICNDTQFWFEEFGHYKLNLTDDPKKCIVQMTAEPDAASLPILETAVTLLALATLWYIVKGIGKRVMAGRLYTRYFAREDNELGSETRILTSEAAPRSPTRSRLRSIDIFRGAAVAMMIFVNSGGGGYAVFSHSVWNGLTIADVVFPWFAFVMGASLVLSINARLRTAISRPTAFYQVLARSLSLALIGILLGSRGATLQDVRLPGVLQRLAATYLLAGALECLFIKTSQNITPGRSLIRDISAGWAQWLATILLASIQVVVSLKVAAPGCPAGYLGPGGLHMSTTHNDSLRNCTGGIVGHIDRVVLGEQHLYAGGTWRPVYGDTARLDPEGLLGCLTGLLLVQAGAHASRIMLAYNHARARFIRLCLWGAVWVLCGGALCRFSKEGGPIPMNKNLWSLSFCLVTGGLAFLVQAALYFAVDLKKKWGGRPLYYAGQNALVLYIGSELLKKHFPLQWRLAAATHAQLLASHAATTLLWLAVAIALHRKRIFISL